MADTDQDQLAADLRFVHNSYFSDRTGEFYDANAASFMAARGYRKMPDRDEAIRIASTAMRTLHVGDRVDYCSMCDRKAQLAVDALLRQEGA